MLDEPTVPKENVPLGMAGGQVASEQLPHVPPSLDGEVVVQFGRSEAHTHIRKRHAWTKRQKIVRPHDTEVNATGQP